MEGNKSKEALIKADVKRARELFATGNTLSYKARINTLLRLKDILGKNKDAILDALHSDLNKSHYEGYMTEYALVISEIEYAIKKLRAWMKPKRQKASLAQFISTVHLHSVPYGTVLIMSPWNYPFQLTMIPLIGAVAAGNVVIVKPSFYSRHTSELLEKIINSEFTDARIKVITGSREENKALLDEEFDYVFFTGSPTVGKLVMESCSKYLTPFTLELGGKSPCIIDKNIDLKKAAKRVLFGKLLNAGQTCVAPDYLLVHEDVYDEFLASLISIYKTMMKGEYRERNFPCIINQKHFDRIAALVDESEVFYQDDFNKANALQYPFTIVKNADKDSAIMQEEIFGPVFPVLKWKKFGDLKRIISYNKNPLALYLFTKDGALGNKVIKEISFGGGCINDTIMHIASHHQPFGGVGRSGIGRYHGKYSFDTFSRKKNIVRKWWCFDLKVRYHPYKNPKGHLPYFLLK